MKRIWRLLLVLARELADENAYQRHLVLAQRKHSPSEWRAFIDDRLRRKYQNGRCC